MSVKNLGLSELIALAAVLAALAGCGPSPEDIARKVQTSMQQRFADDPELSKFGMSVAKVIVVKESGNKYQGMATVLHAGTERQVPVQVTAEGKSVIWKTDPGAFVFVVQHELRKALGQ